MRRPPGLYRLVPLAALGPLLFACQGGPPDEAVPGLALLPRLAGLWSGPATGTPLGAFPQMSMDLRAVDGRVLFSRADLDEKNSLRFAFSLERHGGGPAVVFRNGGLFQGLSRDSRTIYAGDEGGAARFCAEGGGCGYVDARFQLEGALGDRLTLAVTVRGAPHLRWTATRIEARPLPSPFPADMTAGPPDAPFPPLPWLRATVSWQRPLDRDGAVWLILSTRDCSLAAGCQVSRSLRATAPGGATSADLLVDQIHAGSYKATALLDRDGSFQATLRPGSGDGVSLPNQAVTVAAAGESATSLRIIYDIP